MKKMIFLQWSSKGREDGGEKGGGRGSYKVDGQWGNCYGQTRTMVGHEEPVEKTKSHTEHWGVVLESPLNPG